MIALIEQYGGWIDPGSAGYARQTEIARKMLAGEADASYDVEGDLDERQQARFDWVTARMDDSPIAAKNLGPRKPWQSPGW